MLVIHWTRHNQTGEVLANGIHPTARKRPGIPEAINRKGVYVYPYSRNQTLNGNWRRNLKKWDKSTGNYNGFVFRLEPQDFPLYAGYWFQIRSHPDENKFKSAEELTRLYGSFFNGEIINEKSATGTPYNWEDFEIIIPRLIKPKRILKVIRDRTPISKKTSQRRAESLADDQGTD